MAFRVPGRLIDFHNHYYAVDWFAAPLAQQAGVLARAWPLLTGIQAQLAAMDEASIDAKVLTAPAGSLIAPGERLPVTLMERINDSFAGLVTSYPERLLALATIDAFHGDIAAREVERAVHHLGLKLWAVILCGCSHHNDLCLLPSILSLRFLQISGPGRWDASTFCGIILTGTAPYWANT